MRRELAPWASGVLLALPLFLVRFPPMPELAMHEALVSLMRHLHDPAWAPPGLYFVVAPQASQLFHLLAYALSFVMPVEAACKVVVALAIGLLPPLLGRLLARLGRSTWPALLVAPIALGWMFRFGLAPNLVGYAALLFALPSLERSARRPSFGNAARCALLACLLVLAHAAAGVMFALAAGMFAVLRTRRVATVAILASPAVVALALVAVQSHVSAGLVGTNLRLMGDDYGPDATVRLALLPGALFGGPGALRLTALAAVSALAFAGLVSSRAKREPRRGALRVVLWRYRYALVAAGLTVLYLVSPMTTGGATLAAHRFLPGAWAFAVVAFAPRVTSRSAKVLVALVPLVAIAFAIPDFVHADADHRALDAILTRVPMNVSVAQLDLTPRPDGYVAPAVGEAGRVLAERGGRMLFALTDTPPGPVYVPPALQWNEPLLRLARAPYAFMPAIDLRRFAYVLERNDSPRAAAFIETALAPEAEPIDREGPWTLFRSRLTPPPLTAPDEPLPERLPESLAERVSRLAEDSDR